MKKLTKKQISLTALSLIAILGLGFILGYEYKAYGVRKALTEAFSNHKDSGGVDNPDYTSNDDGKLGYKSNYHKTTDTIKFSTQDLKVNSIHSAPTLSSEYSPPWIAKEGTKFIVVDHAVTNTTNNPFMYDPLQLFDKDGKRYEASSDAIGNVDNYMNSRTLAPGVPETGVTVYIVPVDSKDFEFGGLNGKTEILQLIKYSVD